MSTFVRSDEIFAAPTYRAKLVDVVFFAVVSVTFAVVVVVVCVL